MPIEAETHDGAIHEFPDDTPQEVIDRAVNAYLPRKVDRPFGPVTEAIRGASSTEQLEDLPELHMSGLLSGEDPVKTAAVTPALMTATDPNEIAQIVTSNFPNVGLVYTLDAEQKPVPLLVNNATGQATSINRPGLSGFDILQTVGIASAFMPATRAATIPGAILAEGATSAAMEGAQAAAGGDFDPMNVAVDAATGGIGKAVERAGISGRKAIQGQPGAVHPDVVRADEAGIPLATSDVIPTQTFAGRTLTETGDKIPLLGADRAGQQLAREGAVAEVISKYGDHSYAAIVQSLEAQRDRVKSAAGSVIQATGDRVDVALGRAGEALDISSTLKAIAPVQEALADPRVLGGDEALSKLSSLLEVLQQPQTYRTFKENRTAFSEIVDAVDDRGRSQLPSLDKARMTGIRQAMTDDMERAVKANSTDQQFAQWQKANAVYAEQAKHLKRSRLKRILDVGDVTPDAARNMLFSQSEDELKLLYDSLTADGRRNARGAIIHRLARQAEIKGEVTPNSFATQLEKNDRLIQTFFKGRDRKQLEGLRRTLQLTRKAQDAPVTTATGQTVLGGLSVFGLFTEPASTLATLGTIGAMTTLYESAPVRNVLLRLASAPPSAFDEALRNVQSTVTGVLQALNNELTEE